LASSTSGGESIRGRDSPLRVFAPVRSRSFGREVFRAMCSPCAVTCITAD
jgi:hypothetical protein